jgi:hypothetical protein
MGDASTRSRHQVLAPLAKANNIVDGLPEVLAFVRNRVVHPITKPKQKGSVALIDQVLHRRGCDDAPGSVSSFVRPFGVCWFSVSSGCDLVGSTPTTASSAIKDRLRPMRCLNGDQTASIVIRGHAFIQNIRRGHYELGTETASHLRIAEAFDELAEVI